MENLEEVLQALDEFQKMRPSVIPQELEDYLCWVAKTGDPVYQWPLIKTLVREKLTRVMTDFYESCPTLDLAPCPNVEHFNYDTMKSNLLERLESFVNAPFTVQRICELLTAPRKEYNRVDKFMRAIEKNILVVSTREPGPITRRGETGDGMVNGSVEEDAAASVTQQQPPPPSPSQPPSSQQPTTPPQTSAQQPAVQPPTSQDVEMEYWEKDCGSTVTISVHTAVENEPPPSLLHTGVIPATADSALAKNLFADESVREKIEQVAASRTDLATTNYITSVSEFSTISNLNLQPHASSPVSATEPIATAVPVVQSLPVLSGAAIPDDSTTAPGADIAVAIAMNEDAASSQPNLDIENEEIETAATASDTAATSTTTAAATVTTTTTTTAASTTSTSAAATTTVTVVATVIPLTTDTTRKLQAAFQAKRFESDDDKCTDQTSSEKPMMDPSTLVGGTEEELEHLVKNEEASLTNSSSERLDLNEMSRDESRLTESLLQTDVEMRPDTLVDSNARSVAPEEERAPDKSSEEKGRASILEDMEDEENLRSSTSDQTNATAFVESEEKDCGTATSSDERTSVVIVSSSETLYKTDKPIEIHSTVSSSETCFVRDQQPVNQKAENTEEVDTVLEAIPAVASSNSNTNGREEAVQEQPEINDDNLNIMEISNDKIALVESMVSTDSIGIIEKSKEVASVIEKLDPISPAVVETTEGSDNIVSCRSPEDDKLTDIQDDSLANLQGNKACVTIKGNQSSVIESIACRRESMELMEVDDDEESLSTFQQDEPMEHETMEELSKS